jgi:Tol biopolymer transport system component
MMAKKRLSTARIAKSHIFYFIILLMAISCNKRMPVFDELNQNAVLSPDYTSVTIPPNIAPLNFRINETADKYMVRFHNSNGIDFMVRSGNGSIKISEKKWHKLLSTSISKEFYVDIVVKKSQKWVKYNTITNYVAQDSIDKYLVYRLIDPEFETWNVMGIYQRNLENFKVTPVILNRVSDGNCVNCHTFCQNSSKTMMFHMRSEHAGTVIYKDGKLSKINTKTSQTIANGMYPAWHPSGKYIAFSVNNIVQSYHAIPGRTVEVYDTLSNIVLYDVNNNVITSCRALSDPDHLETFPTWSPDGRYLYYCCAIKNVLKKPDYETFMDVHSKIRYDLLRIAFDQENRRFGAVDTVLTVSDSVSSISLPRISPDGRYILFCKSGHGNLTIWQPESDLYLLDLKTGIVSKPDINSNKSESFHTWSSTGRWIVFSSRRDDGLLYTRPYFAYFDTSGKMHKPFVLPQKSTEHYFKIMKSYNLPELVTSKIDLNPRKFAGIIKAQATNAGFKDF